MLSSLVTSIGLPGALLLYMGIGVNLAAAVCLALLLIVMAVFLAESVLQNLIRFTDKSVSRANEEAKKNVRFAVVVLLLGSLFYTADL